MDRFVSNATPMGGSIGRGDGMVGAVEAQKAEGVLHIHFFLFKRSAHSAGPGKGKRDEGRGELRAKS